MVSQCPIDAYNEFTYVMRAENSGTHWYHSHYIIQRADGLHGAFIILEEDEKDEEISWMPLVVTDWWNTDSTFLAGNDPYRYGNTLGKRMTGSGLKACRTDEKSFMTGVKMSTFCVDSIVANGRGQYRTNEDEFEFSVLEEYRVSKTTTRIQLKTIHAGFEHPILIRAVDGRKLTITAQDGRRVLPEEGDGIFMGVGETLNIEVDFPLEEEWIELIAEVMFEGIGKKSEYHEKPYVKITFARDASVSRFEIKKQLFAAYPESNVVEPFSFQTENTVSEKVLLNCPAKTIGDMSCKTVVDFKRDPKYESRFANPPPSIEEKPDRVIDVNMNFAIGPAINGLEFKYPETPFFFGVENTEKTQCTAAMITDGGHCTQIIEVKKGELVEFR